ARDALPRDSVGTRPPRTTCRVRPRQRRRCSRSGPRLRCRSSALLLQARLLVTFSCRRSFLIVDDKDDPSLKRDRPCLLVLVCNSMKLHPDAGGAGLFPAFWSWSVTAIPLNSWSESDQEAIRQQLDRILHSGPFHQSQRRQRFLEYLVNETL